MTFKSDFSDRTRYSNSCNEDELLQLRFGKQSEYTNTQEVGRGEQNLGNPDKPKRSYKDQKISSNKKRLKQRANKSKVQFNENNKEQKLETYHRETQGDDAGDDAGGKHMVASRGKDGTNWGRTKILYGYSNEEIRYRWARQGKDRLGKKKRKNTGRRNRKAWCHTHGHNVTIKQEKRGQSKQFSVQLTQQYRSVSSA